MDRMVIRGRTSVDLPAAGALLVEVHALDGYPVEGVDDPQAWLVSDVVIAAWVARIEDRIVGHVCLSRPTGGDEAARLWAVRAGRADNIAVLSRLFVDPEFRSAGLGARLVGTVMSEGDRRGLRLTLDVMVKDDAAIRLYERLGWSCIGEASHAYGAQRAAEARCFLAPVAS